MKVMNGFEMTLEEGRRFLCVWLLYYVSNFADSRMKVPRFRSSPAVKCEAKLLSLGVNCRLRLAGLGKKREETVKPTCFYMSKATSVPQTNHSQCSSPVEALNLIVESKCQPVELDNSTIELHLPSRRKNSLQSYCSVDFDFLASMRFDMTFDVTYDL